MAITVTVNPAAKQAAYRPIIIEATSNRDDVISQSVTAVTSGTGGFARFAIVSPTLLVGDIVTGEGFTGTSVVYNVRMTVTVVVTGGSGYVETDKVYSAASAGAPKLTRTNDNFQLKGEVIVFDKPKITITGAISGGSGLTQISTLTAHGYVAGDRIRQYGTTSYNGAFVVDSVQSTILYKIAIAFVADETGTVRGGTTLGTKRQAAISLGGVPTFRFNIANFLQAGLKPNLTTTAGTIITPNEESILYYTLYLTEEWDDVDGLLKEAGTLFISEKQVVRISLTHTETQTLDAFFMGSATQRFLTNAPKQRSIREGDEEQLSFLVNPDVSYKVRTRKYTVAGTLVATIDSGLIAIIDGRGIVRVNDALLLDGTFVITKAEVLLINVDNNVRSETITFNIDRTSCPVRMLFENYRGGFDGYNFKGAFKQINNSKKTAFTRDLGITFAKMDRGETVLGIEADETFEVWSEFLTRAEGIWLAELINSPSVFVQQGADFLPITILNSNNPVDDNQTPLQLKIQYRMSNQPITLSN